VFNISDYFKKFKKIEGDTLVEKDIVLSILHDVCGVRTIQFEIEKGILYIKGSPMLKSVLYTKKTHILRLLKEKLPHKRISDIR